MTAKRGQKGGFQPRVGATWKCAGLRQADGKFGNFMQQWHEH